MGLYEVCEIVRLGNYDPKLRAAAEQVRDFLLKETKAEHNLLKHEKADSFQKIQKAIKSAPLLPRFDVI